MTTAREIADAWTASQIETFIAESIQDRDFKAVEALLSILVIKDPRRASEVWDVIQAGLTLARRRHETESA